MKPIKKNDYRCIVCDDNPINCKCSTSRSKTGSTGLVFLLSLFLGLCSFAFTTKNDSINCTDGGYLRISGNILDSNNKTTDAIMLITDTNNTFIKTINLDKGTFNIKLPLFNAYVVTFIKSNHRSKAIMVNTTCIRNCYLFEFDVLMEKTTIQRNPVNVAYIYFDNKTGSFDYKVLVHKKTGS